MVAHDSAAPEGRSLDWPGQIVIAVALFALLYAVIQGAEDGWGSPLVVGGFVVAAVGLVVFVLIEQRVDRPLIQLELFSNRMFTVSAIVTVLGHVRLPRHGVRHQHPALGHPGLHTAPDLGRLRPA